jgi:hypothetical protein
MNNLGIILLVAVGIYYLYVQNQKNTQNTNDSNTFSDIMDSVFGATDFLGSGS